MGETAVVDPGRRSHYATFYDARVTGPVAVVWGNCQAEATRVLLAASPGFPVPTVRVPPVHELVEADLPPLGALLAHVSVFVTQPVRRGYRGLPIGTDDIVDRLRPGAEVVRVPVIRYSGLHPYAALVRHPSSPAAGPPIVAYHDLRTLAAAAGRRRGRRPPAAVLGAAAAASVAELAARERGTQVAVSDLLRPSGARAVHTLNHPGNVVLTGMAARILEVLHLPGDVGDPGRELLGSVRAPLEADVVDALGLGVAPSPDWIVDGSPVDPAAVHDAHLEWYGEHPQWVRAGLERHAERLGMLGL